MITQRECVQRILEERPCDPGTPGEAFAPANIALCKYWGKRDDVLNLPVTSSLSVSLGNLGTSTRVAPANQDQVTLNGEPVDPEASFSQRLCSFLDLFRAADGPRFRVDTTNTIPTAAGLASSASGFAALTLALDQCMGWNLDRRALSMLARLGSGSASRSLYDGFVEWHTGTKDDGTDSFAEPLQQPWPDLRIATVTVTDQPKPIGSREAMARTRDTATLYQSWPEQVAHDLRVLRAAIEHRDFNALGRTAENNALTMHATMIATWPPVVYWLPESVELMHRIWYLRQHGLSLFFTMDAGPNLKLLFRAGDEDTVVSQFDRIKVIAPFGAQS
jgi:diphosphomevalonate decarboxylase